MCFVAPRISSPTARTEHGSGECQPKRRDRGCRNADHERLRSRTPIASSRSAATLLDQGCDGLNICGTTGEATSFTVAQRMAIMSAAASALPLSRLMVGTGAAALADAVALTKARRRARLRRRAHHPALLLQGAWTTTASSASSRVSSRRRLRSRSTSTSTISPRFPASPIRPRSSSRLCSEFGSPHRRPEGFLRRSRLCGKGSQRRCPSFASSRATRRCCFVRAPASSPAASRPAPT